MPSDWASTARSAPASRSTPAVVSPASYLGKNCRGKEKLRRLNEWIESRHPDGVDVYAYGNSRGDRRMLRAATYPFDVGRLGPFGALRHFPRLATSLAVVGYS